jgi:hypothetical protein
MARSMSAFGGLPQLMHLAPEPLGLYFRIGRNDYRELLQLFTSGESRFLGVVCDPTYSKFQGELVDRALERRLDVILDPRTLASATAGGFTSSLGQLPWGRGRVHVEEDFQGASGKRLMGNLARFAGERHYTQVLTPTHLLRTISGKWWDIDQASTSHLRIELDRAGGDDVSLLYSLAISYSMLRDRHERRALISGLKSLPIEGVWISVDGLGSGSTPTAVRTYLEAIAEFHTLNIPVVADHVGGLVGLALAAFGGVGAIAHGVTNGERFDTAHWRKPRTDSSFGLSKRVYIPTLDLLLKSAEARSLFAFGRRATALFGCNDTRCCPRGVMDMLENPAQHFLRRRIDEILNLSAIPLSLRPARFVDQRLRSTTDAVLAAANLEWTDVALAKRMREQRKRLDRMRIALGDLAASAERRSISIVPHRRIVRVVHERPPVSH